VANFLQNNLHIIALRVWFGGRTIVPKMYFLAYAEMGEMKKFLMLTAVAMLTVGSATGCRGFGRDRCEQDRCDPCAHACNVSTPMMMGGGTETLLPSPAPTQRNLNVLPGPVDGSSNG